MGAERLPLANGRHKPSLSSSPLAHPQTPIHRLASRIQDYYYFPVPDPLYVLLGTTAANMLRGDPVWLMIIGAPSSGKTSLIRSLLKLPGVHDASDITGPAAFLSGTSKRHVQKGATGGILRKVGKRGLILLEDYTASIIDGLTVDIRKKVLNALRLIYNGRWTRDIGEDGGQSLTWTGKIGLIAGGTETIDQLHMESLALGERWVYYRYPRTDGFGEAMRAIQNRDPDQVREEVRDWVAAFFEEVGLVWPCAPECSRDHEHIPEVQPRQLEDWEANRIIVMASFITRVSVAVPRDWRTHEVTGHPSIANPARLTSVLSQLYLGLERVGLTREVPHGNEERWRVVAKVAVDSAPELRVDAVYHLSGAKVPMPLGELRKKLQCSANTTYRLVEDLSLAKVVEYVPAKGSRDDEERMSGGAMLTKESRKLIEAGWTTIPEVR